MALFKIAGSKLSPVKDVKFDSYFEKEKKLQNFTENNLQELFGLEFISTEFNIETFWLDSLAYDPVNKSFVIIEYKKVENFSLMDQGQTYLNLVLDHKADVLLEYINKKDKTIKKNDVDWSQTKVMFIGPKFNTYQKRALSPNLPFELWEVMVYEGGLIEYDQIIPAGFSSKYDKKQTTILSGTAAREIKTYTEEDLISKAIKSKDLYLELKEKIFAIEPTLIFHPTKTYIGIQKAGNWRTIISISFQQNRLLLDFTRSQPNDFSDPEKKLAYKENSMKNFNQHISTLIVDSQKDVDYAIFLFKQTYKRFLEQYAEA